MVVTYYDAENTFSGFATMSATMKTGEVTEFATSFSMPSGKALGSVKVYEIAEVTGTNYSTGMTTINYVRKTNYAYADKLVLNDIDIRNGICGLC